MIHKDSTGWELSGTNKSVTQMFNQKISAEKTVNFFRWLEVVKWRRSHSVLLEFAGRKWQLCQV